MGTDTLKRAVYIVLLIALGVYLFEKVYAVYQLFSRVVWLFGLAWLIAFMLSPLVDQITAFTVRLPSHASAQRTFALPRLAAVALIYILLLIIGVAAALYLVPLVVSQLIQLQGAVVAYFGDMPKLITAWQDYLTARGIDINLARTFLVESQILSNVVKILTDLGSLLVQNIPAIAGGLFGAMIDLTILLVMSFYMTLDGPRLTLRLIQAMPHQWRRDAELFVRVIDLRFGNFIRSQVTLALIYAVATAGVMSVARLDYIAIASLLAAGLIIIPLIGGWLAMVAPVIIALFRDPGLALAVWAALAIFQIVLFQVIMPRLTGTFVGLHPLLVFLAILVGYPVGGVWGSLFAIPAAGVLVSVVDFVHAKVTGLPVEAAVLRQVPDRTIDARELAARKAWGRPADQEPTETEPH